MFAKDSRVENFLTHIGVTWRWVDDLSYKALEPNWDYNNTCHSAKADSRVSRDREDARSNERRTRRARRFEVEGQALLWSCSDSSPTRSRRYLC